MLSARTRAYAYFHLFLARAPSCGSLLDPGQFAKNSVSAIALLSEGMGGGITATAAATAFYAAALSFAACSSAVAVN